MKDFFTDLAKQSVKCVFSNLHRFIKNGAAIFNFHFQRVQFSQVSKFTIFLIVIVVR